jgi:hypothetical protein
VAQVVRGPGRVGGHGLVVGKDWLTVGGLGQQGETVEFWVRPRSSTRARDRQIALGWGASSLRFRTALERSKWSYVAVSWDDASIRLDLDGETNRTEVAASPTSRFLALPNKNLPTIGICNKPSSTP